MFAVKSDANYYLWHPTYYLNFRVFMLLVFFDQCFGINGTVKLDRDDVASVCEFLNVDVLLLFARCNSGSRNPNSNRLQVIFEFSRCFSRIL